MTPAEVVTHIRHVALHHPDPLIRASAHAWIGHHDRAVRHGLDTPPLPPALQPRTQETR